VDSAPPVGMCTVYDKTKRDKIKIQFLKYVEEMRLLDQERNKDTKDRLNIRE